jgi:hypothetical protein
LQCCTEDGSGPPGVGFQELASNRPELLRSKGVVVNVRGVMSDIAFPRYSFNRFRQVSQNRLH